MAALGEPVRLERGEGEAGGGQRETQGRGGGGTGDVCIGRGFGKESHRRPSVAQGGTCPASSEQEVGERRKPQPVVPLATAPALLPGLWVGSPGAGGLQ